MEVGAIDYYWNDLDCSTLKTSILCNRPAITEYKTDTLILVGVRDTTYTWVAANSYCESTYGSTLGSIHDSTENSDAYSTYQTYAVDSGTPNVWIGFTSLICLSFFLSFSLPGAHAHSFFVDLLFPVWSSKPHKGLFPPLSLSFEPSPTILCTVRMRSTHGRTHNTTQPKNIKMLLPMDHGNG